MTGNENPVYPAGVSALARRLYELPGGFADRRQAEKAALTLADRNRAPRLARELPAALSRWRQLSRLCAACRLPTAAPPPQNCAACRELPADDPRQRRICVTASLPDALAMRRRPDLWNGRVYRLDGCLEPHAGERPEELGGLPELLAEIASWPADPTAEILAATPHTLAGGLTAQFLQQECAPLGIAVTVLGRGIPKGGSVARQAQATLQQALADRTQCPIPEKPVRPAGKRKPARPRQPALPAPN